MRKVTLIPGDGVGPEVIDAAVRCIEATGATIRWERVEAGEKAMQEFGTPLPKQVIRSIEKNKVALKGPITTPVGSGFRSVNVALRKIFDLYACVRPCKLYEGVKSRFKQVDLVVVRENTEDLYSGIEFAEAQPETRELIDFLKQKEAEIRQDSAISLKVISRSSSERIARFAFNYAVENGRRKVTVVHKANIMKYSDGLFLEVAREVAREFPQIEFEDKIVDNMCMQLVRKPEQYDVILAPNLYGDLLSDLCAGLVGGLGMAPSANIGEGMAIFEPTHGSSPKYAGLNKVNPTAAILSGALMLRYLGEEEAADKLERAVARVIAQGKYVTYDLKEDPADPTAVGTREMADAIIKEIEG
jgi:isocitrate dehydrogenase (NAD+)